MEERVKKPLVEPEKRQEWLKRYEAGELPPHIAAADHFDVRTVRTHIQKAKQEREIKDARAMVLRNAIESHYSDLCKYAAKLSELGHGESAAESPKEEYIHSALRQHLPRSPIWSYLKQREALSQQTEPARQLMAKKIEKMVKSDQSLNSCPGLSKIVASGIIDALMFQTNEWAQGRQGLKLPDSFSKQDMGDLINLHYGALHLGNLKKGKKDDIALVKKVLSELEVSIRQTGEYMKLEKLYTDLNRIERNLKDELAVITLRRIVPGRCRYCPL